MSADSQPTHLVYLFPGTAYLLELLPSKGSAHFQVQQVREIRGQFAEGEHWSLINLQKLASKLDTTSYTVVLPDSLFRQHVFELEAGSETEAHKKALRHVHEAYEIQEELTFCHLFLLSTHRGKYTFQLVAVDANHATLLYEAFSAQAEQVRSFLPLSWTMKAFVSLEPSMTLAQVGNDIFIARHYIGVDQTFVSQKTHPTALAEYLKKQKQSDSQLQTLYLAADEETERLIKKELDKIIPIQQLVSNESTIEGLPAVVKFLAEQAARTLSLTELRLPSIKVEELENLVTQAETAHLTATANTSTSLTTPTVHTEEDAIDMPEVSLPTPTLPTPTAAPEPTPIATPPVLKVASEELLSPVVEKEKPLPSSPLSTQSAIESVSLHSESLNLPSETSVAQESSAKTDEPDTLSHTNTSTIGETTLPSFYDKVHTTLPEATPVKESNRSWVSLDNNAPSVKNESSPLDSISSESSGTTHSKIIIQNSNDASELLKIIGLTVGVIILTVVAGLGIGYALLSFSLSPQQIAVEPVSSPTSSTQPAPVVSPSPQVTPSPSPEPVSKEKLQILVVNATTTAGKAGKYKSLLEKAGFKNITAGNAKGKYDAGTYLLMKTESSAIKTEVEKALGVSVTAKVSVKTEDPSEQKDLVVVIAE